MKKGEEGGGRTRRSLSSSLERAASPATTSRRLTNERLADYGESVTQRAATASQRPSEVS